MFPQLKGLGMSSTSMYYGIGSLAEAQAYLAHPVLGPRLRECVQLLLDAPGSAADILGGDVSAEALQVASLAGVADLFAVVAPTVTDVP